MKYLTTITLLFAIVSIAQSQISDHLIFKGVPIDGTLSEYVSKMKQNGFTHLGTENGIAILNGDFAGYKDCNVGVATLNQKDLVYKIAVLFPARETWSTLSGNYFDLKQMLIEKYGNPSDELKISDLIFSQVMMATKCIMLSLIIVNTTQYFKQTKETLNYRSITMA